MTPSGGRGITQARGLLVRVIDDPLERPVTLFLGSRPNESGIAEFRDVPIKAELERELVDLVGVWRRRAKKNPQVPKLREYDSEPQPQDSRKTQLVDIDSNDHVRRAMDPIRDGTDIPVWDRRDAAMRKPWSFVIGAKQPGDTRIRFFGRITPGKQLKGTGRVIAFLEGRRFQGLEDPNAIILDPVIDCAEVERYLFIFNPLRFESMFAYAESLAAYATETIDGIQQFIEPDKLVILRHQVGENRAYLRRVAGRIRVDLATADHGKIKKAIERCGFNVTMVVADGKLTLGFDCEDPHDLIKLLTDRAVESMISGKGYIAGSLEPVTPADATK